ncbi:MAG TPA: diaminopimelate epimerase [Chthoniobacteraceae bacterium]|jgi:diaminopimelate epimerase
MLTFTKMNGAGNDFVLIDNRDRRLSLDREQIARLCDRHRGIGGDGLLMLEPAENGADFRMRYFNSDGGEAEMCGNGARCFARFAQKVSGQTGDVSFETMAGVISARFFGEIVQIQMSEPHSLRLNEELNVGDQRQTVHSLNTGVPHAVLQVSDLGALEVRGLGSALRFHPHFAPKGTNVNFFQPTGLQSISIRTYERGVEDETLACGTGMVASALIFHELTGAASPVEVQVRGGETLQIGFEKVDGKYRNVTLTGPADFTFEGQVEL